jgi:hypothetical protein
MALTIPKGQYEACTLWESLVEVIMTTCASSHPVMRNHTFLFDRFAMILRKLKDTHLEYVLPVIVLLLPRSDLVGPLATCDLLPEGLPNPAILQLTDEQVDELTVSMSGSQVYANIQREAEKVDADLADAEAKLVEAAEAKAAAAALAGGQTGSKTKAKPKSSSKKAQQQSARTERISGTDMTQEFLDFLNSTMAYMLKLDKQQYELVLAFQMISIHGALQGKTLLSRGGECKPVKSFAGLSKAYKSHIYRKACLQPRASDVDFAPGEVVDTVDAADADSGACSPVVRLTHEAVLYQNVGALSCE